MSLSQDKRLRAVIWCAVSTEAQATEEKESLPVQEAEARALCEQHGWQVADVMIVSGHSRRYVDIHELAAAAAEEGITAFYDLMRHWRANNFDVLVVRDADRFARTQALHAYVTERTIDMGARIYSLADGWIDKNNYRMWIAMGGYKAASNIDDLVKKRNWAMDGLAKQGLPTTSHIPMSHLLIRNPNTGAAAKMVVNEALRPLWNAVADLILEGISWREIENELFKRFGYGFSANEPYNRRKFNKLVMTPTFWGNSARHYRGVGYQKGQGDGKPTKRGKTHTGLWMIEPGHEIPSGVLIHYDTHEAVYTGELATRIKTELYRRDEIVKGRTKPSVRYWYAGLFVCENCKHLMNTLVGSSGSVYLRCTSRFHQSSTRPKCENRKMVSEKRARLLVDEKLREMLDLNDPMWLAQVVESTHNVSSQISAIELEINRIEETVRLLIRNEAMAGDEVRHIYAQEIEKANTDLKAMRRHLISVQAKAMAQNNTARVGAYEELKKLSIDELWKQEGRYINQLLHQLMGKSRFVVKDGEFIGTAEVSWKRS